MKRYIIAISKDEWMKNCRDEFNSDDTIHYLMTQLLLADRRDQRFAEYDYTIETKNEDRAIVFTMPGLFDDRECLLYMTIDGCIEYGDISVLVDVFKFDPNLRVTVKMDDIQYKGERQ